MVTLLKIDRKISICLLLMICLLGAAGCSKPKSSYDYLTQARQNREHGNDQAALIDLKNALKKDPKNGEARYLLAQILNEHGEGSAAEIELRKAVELGVDKSLVAAALGEALFLQGQYQKVLDDVNVTVHDKGKVAADIYNVRGNTYLALRKADEAKSAFETALKEYPDSADAYLGMGRLAAAGNDVNEALHQTDIALSKDPTSTKGWLMKARLLRVQNKNEEARTAYQHVLQIDRRNIPAHLGLASMALVAGQLDAAKAEMDAAAKISPEALTIQYAQAVVDFLRGKLHEAQEAIQKVLKAAPDHLPSILLHGAIAYTQGSYEQARSDLSKVITQYPGNAYARRLLAATQLKLGETDQALATLQPLLNVANADAQTLALGGEAYLKARNFAKATEYLERAIRLNPQAQQIQTQLAISHLGVGNTEQGLDELTEAAKQASGQSPADIFLIVTHLQRKEYDQALTAISNLEKKLGPNPVTHNLRGVALLGKQDFSSARKAFEQALAIQPSYVAAAANLARLDLRDNRPDDARKRFESVLEKDKNNVEAMVALAELAGGQKHEQEYVSWLEKAAEADPKAISPRAGLVRYNLAKKDNLKALAIARDAVNANPDSPEALDLLGTAQLVGGDTDSAVATFANLVQNAPGSPDAYLRLALAQMAAKKNAEARATLNKALEIKPDHMPSLDALLRLELADKKAGAALQVAQKMQKLQPGSPVGHDREADVLVSVKRFPEAIKAYRQALDRGAPTATLIKLLGTMTASGDKKGAERYLVTWINQHPEDVGARSYVAQIYMASGRNKEAISQYEALRRVNPNDASVINSLAILYQREKDGRAVATAEQALKLAPENAAVLDTVGWIFVEQGDLPRGLELLGKAVAKEPKISTLRYHYGVALSRAGKKAEAKKELETAITGGQKFPELEDAKTLFKSL